MNYTNGKLLISKFLWCNDNMDLVSDLDTGLCEECGQDCNTDIKLPLTDPNYI